MLFAGGVHAAKEACDDEEFRKNFKSYCDKKDSINERNASLKSGVIGLKCDTKSQSSSRTPATALFILRDHFSASKAVAKGSTYKGDKLIQRYLLLEGKWSEPEQVDVGPNTYKFGLSNNSDKTRQVSYLLHRGDLSLRSNEEICTDYRGLPRCLERTPIKSDCVKFCFNYQKVGNYTNWNCKIKTNTEIRKYAEEAQKYYEKDNQI
jgi:hypothetical protein